MTTLHIANRLADLCRQGKSDEAFDTLYTHDAVSVEAAAGPGFNQEVKGLAAIKAKGQWWLSNHEVHAANVNGPWPHGDRFILGFQFDVTNKPSGARMQIDEAALYTVKNGKIMKEEFFYAAEE
jgi:hypothetical protein